MMPRRVCRPARPFGCRLRTAPMAVMTTPIRILSIRIARSRIQKPAFGALAEIVPAAADELPACIKSPPKFWREYITGAASKTEFGQVAPYNRAMSETAPYRKPDAFTTKVLQPLVNAFSMTPTLTVRGRSSGKAHTVSVLPIEVEGKRYLVAPRGDTQWARNLRAVGEADLKLGRERMHVKATEI